MATQYSGFRATDPIARSIGVNQYEVFFCIYDSAGRKRFFRDQKGSNSLPLREHKREAQASAQVLLEAISNTGY